MAKIYLVVGTPAQSTWLLIQAHRQLLSSEYSESSAQHDEISDLLDVLCCDKVLYPGQPSVPFDYINARNMRLAR